eukprot:GHVQ01014385.1.p1 GENE.GHVQ01014385.1~~GHVQ01014385.1.p1  ORF type:complete len:891 (+),score=95.02 GHVQ01014385.1:323-2674(+)
MASGICTNTASNMPISTVTTASFPEKPSVTCVTALTSWKSPAVESALTQDKDTSQDAARNALNMRTVPQMPTPAASAGSLPLSSQESPAARVTLAPVIGKSGAVSSPLRIPKSRPSPFHPTTAPFVLREAAISDPPAEVSVCVPPHTGERTTVSVTKVPDSSTAASCLVKVVRKPPCSGRLPGSLAPGICTNTTSEMSTPMVTAAAFPEQGSPSDVAYVTPSTHVKSSAIESVVTLDKDVSQDSSRNDLNTCPLPPTQSCETHTLDTLPEDAAAIACSGLPHAVSADFDMKEVEGVIGGAGDGTVGPGYFPLSPSSIVAPNPHLTGSPKPPERRHNVTLESSAPAIENVQSSFVDSTDEVHTTGSVVPESSQNPAANSIDAGVGIPLESVQHAASLDVDTCWRPYSTPTPLAVCSPATSNTVSTHHQHISDILEIPCTTSVPATAAAPYVQETCHPLAYAVDNTEVTAGRCEGTCVSTSGLKDIDAPVPFGPLMNPVYRQLVTDLFGDDALEDDGASINAFESQNCTPTPDSLEPESPPPAEPVPDTQLVIAKEPIKWLLKIKTPKRTCLAERLRTTDVDCKLAEVFDLNGTQEPDEATGNVDRACLKPASPKWPRTSTSPADVINLNSQKDAVSSPPRLTGTSIVVTVPSIWGTLSSLSRAYTAKLPALRKRFLSVSLTPLSPQSPVLYSPSANLSTKSVVNLPMPLGQPAVQSAGCDWQLARNDDVWIQCQRRIIPELRMPEGVGSLSMHSRVRATALICYVVMCELETQHWKYHRCYATR